MKNSIIVLLVVFLAWSCKKDDDDGGNAPVKVAIRPLDEVAAENDAEIRRYLETHFYNYTDFENPPSDFDFKIKLDTIDGENIDKTPLIEQVESKTVNVSSNEFLLDTDEKDIPHKYYYLVVRENGEGEKSFPTIADSTFLRYEGRLLDGKVFDAVNAGGTWFDLPTFQFPGKAGNRAFRGVGEGMVNFKPGGGIIEHDDGTYTVEDYGIGMIILPSGLGTFNGRRGIISPYSPLIFTIDLLVVIETDHDGDGIPSIDEDSNKDGILYNDDTDGDDIPDYLDADS
ncbi:MAG: peptidylprolyl isomerase [Maribacter sp.]|nr:MAG: peptidylprolyl isomerase [Maribacter sp.]